MSVSESEGNWEIRCGTGRGTCENRNKREVMWLGRMGVGKKIVIDGARHEKNEGLVGAVM